MLIYVLTAGIFALISAILIALDRDIRWGTTGKI
jgi:hypothetical protein